ncbi:MAG: hypothetical protein NXI24_03870 [bacterium]|nr:hypothetical protein [bacterium]
MLALWDEEVLLLELAAIYEVRTASEQSSAACRLASQSLKEQRTVSIAGIETARAAIASVDFKRGPKRFRILIKNSY